MRGQQEVGTVPRSTNAEPIQQVLVPLEVTSTMLQIMAKPGVATLWTLTVQMVMQGMDSV